MKKLSDLRKPILGFFAVSAAVLLLFPLLYAVAVPDITATDTVLPETDLQVPFGYITAGSSSMEETINIRNDGLETLHISDIQLMGTNVDDFILDLDSAPLACGPAYLTSSGAVSQCNMTVAFAPLSEGSKTAYVRVTSDDPDENPLDISLSGTGSATAVPDIYVIDPTYPYTDLLVPFGSLEAGLTSGERTISIYNGGIGSLDVTDIQLTGTDASDFLLSSPSTPLSCGPAVLTSTGPSYDDCSMTVSFSPLTEGSKSAILRITNNDPDEGTVDVALTGTATPAPIPDIAATDTVSPEDDLQVPFGSVSVGTSSLEETISVENHGSGSLKITDVQLTGTNTDDFTIDLESAPMACGTGYMTSTGIVLGPAYITSTTTVIDYCNMKVAFTPQAEGARTAAVSITSDDPDENPLDISLSGSGSAIPAPDIQVTDSIAPTGDLNMDFGTVTETFTSDELITINNVGNANLVLGTIASSDPLSAPFSILADNCSGETLAPAANCTLTIRFAPQGAGAYTDSFDIPSNDPDESSVTVNLAGTGSVLLVPDIAAEDSVPSATDLQVPFGSITVGLSSSEETISLQNDGNGELTISDIQLNGNNPDDFVLDLTSAPMACGTAYMTSSGIVLGPAIMTSTGPIVENCNVLVAFSPQSDGGRDAIVRITSDDPDENPLDLTLSGTGLPAGQNNPPAVPQLIYPANAQEGLSTEVTIKWAAASDPDGDNVTYYLYVSEDPSFIGVSPSIVASIAEKTQPYAGAGLVLFAVVLAGGASRKRKLLAILLGFLVIGMFMVSCGSGGGSGGSGSSPETHTYTVTGLSPTTTYYWKIVADDGNGNQTESPVWSFTTE